MKIQSNRNSNLVKIGIFDSGIGGLSILLEIKKLIPEADFYYFADDHHSPYGTKSEEFIIERSLVVSQVFKDEGVDLIVVACNTATAVAIERLRENSLIPIVGVEPYINILNQCGDKSEAIKKSVVITTELTGKSLRFKNLKKRLDPGNQVEHVCTPNLANLVEKIYSGELSVKDPKISSELNILSGKNYSHVILGCTHYPLIKNSIESITSLETISPCYFVAKRVGEVLQITSSDSSTPDKDSTDRPIFFQCSSRETSWSQERLDDLLKNFSL